jgi:hypothetical protein
MAAPGYLLLLVSRVNPELGVIDVIFGNIIIVLLVIETVADQQQWGKCILKSFHMRMLNHYRISKCKARLPKDCQTSTRLQIQPS